MPSEPHHPDDEKLLRQLGYHQELSRRMSGFSNFATSLSIICILAGGITSFHVGLCSAGGASIGLGWPLVGLFSLCVAATMAQVASAFPTAVGLLLVVWFGLERRRFKGPPQIATIGNEI